MEKVLYVLKATILLLIVRLGHTYSELKGGVVRVETLDSNWTFIVSFSNGCGL